MVHLYRAGVGFWVISVLRTGIAQCNASNAPCKPHPFPLVRHPPAVSLSTAWLLLARGPLQAVHISFKPFNHTKPREPQCTQEVSDVTLGTKYLQNFTRLGYAMLVTNALCLVTLSINETFSAWDTTGVKQQQNCYLGVWGVWHVVSGLSQMTPMTCSVWFRLGYG